MEQDNIMSYLQNMYGNRNDPAVSPTNIGFGMDWLNTNAKGLGTVASIGGLGLGAYDTFFGDTAKTNKLNQTLLKQQIANNKELMADKQAFQDTWANAGNNLAKASNGLGMVKS